MTRTTSSPPLATEPLRAVGRSLRLAYLTTEYPKVSHTFIRREIQELEQRGHSVMRLAIRNSGGAIADASDQDESSKTIHCLSQPKWRVVMAASLVKSTRPLRWIRATRMAIAMSRASDRGLLRHLAYLVEAAWLLRVLQREKIEHVHVHFGTNAAAVARLVRCLGGPPYSMTVHGPNEFDSPRGFSLAEKVIDAEFVVAISDYCAAQIRRWAPHAHWHKIHVVHCTVGDEFFQPSTPISASSNSLLCVGRLSAQKGQLLLIDAMRHLIDEGLEARLVLAGDGEMRRIVEQSIAARGLQNYVSITGWVDEAKVRRLLSESRALVQPSFAEGLPVVMMEAMAMARPVIGTMIAAIPELLIHGGNGWLIPAGNIDELVSAMRDALKMSADRLNAMGLAGRERVRERHFTRTEVDKLERLFDAYVPLRDASIQRKAAGVSDATIPALEEPS